mmetsp:Transcript_16881/g.28196  ORF Transcript_16881/g.28196 Transcript_16881/m.28196 type:complete len:206 (-) Transcript_16881:151-768(-)
MPDYGNKSYWDERYAAGEEFFDWHQNYATLKDHIDPYIVKDDNFEILIAGCGNSQLGADIYDTGVTNITNIDTSMVVVNQMVDANRDREEMEFSVMDATNMEHIPEQCFDLIIDKALLDTFLCFQDNLDNVENYLLEAHRVLKDDGHLLVISHGLPDTRLEYFPADMWAVEVVEMAKPAIDSNFLKNELSPNHFLFVCTKVQSNA